MFLDLNAYFASVEQQERPELRNRPVAVVPVEADTSFVIAASYEAKRFGVKTGTRIADAKRMCPEILCVTGTPHVYTHYHRRVIEVAETVLPVEKVCSIDEMYFRLIGEEREPGKARELAMRIKTALRVQIGECIRASIGIAPNIYLAKTATDMQKPDGLVVLQADDLPRALFGLQLTDLTGINKKMEARLHAAGIFTVERLCEMSRNELRQSWGSVVGERWWYKLRGIELHEEWDVGQSLGHSHVMAPQFRNDKGTKDVLMRLIQKAGARLRSEGLACQAMAVGVTGRRSWHDHCRFAATADATTINEHFLSMWDHRDFESPMKASVTFTGLCKIEDSNPSLFDEAWQRAELSDAVDSLNARFGKHAVYLAGIQKARTAAPERIAFQKTELFVEGKGDHEYLLPFKGLAIEKHRSKDRARPKEEA